MNKPIIRWTIGNTSDLGYESLRLSVKLMLNLYKKQFDYCVLHNNVEVEILKKIIPLDKVKLIEQNWDLNPIKTIKKNKSSIWKLIPPRINLKTHEIFIDNDIIPIKKLKKIDDFLASENKVLLTEDCLRYQGKYTKLFKDDDFYYNAGFFGIPPYYDFEKEIKKTWFSVGEFDTLTSSDEQGLTTATLKKNENILIGKDEILMVFPNGKVKKNTYIKENNSNVYELEDFNFSNNNNSFFHFVTLNKKNKNKYWSLFTKEIKNKIKLL